MKWYSIHLAPQSRLKHIPSLDGLRGIAVWAVILYHCFPFFVITKIGWAGVDLFFVLSGFLITGILYDTKNTSKYYVNFITRRVLRIFPLYYFVLIGVFFILPIFPNLLTTNFKYYENHQLYFWFYIQNWLYSIDGFPKDHTLIHFWSLAVEEQFYIFWPWIVKICPTKHLFKACIILIICSIFFRMSWGFHFNYSVVYQYMATLSRVDALLIGGVMAILIRQNPRWLESMALPTLVISSIVILTVILSTGRLGFLSLSSIYTVIDFCCASLLLLCLSVNPVPILTRVVNNSILQWSGKYSYGLYVYHYIIFNILGRQMEPTFSSLMKNNFLANLTVGIITVVLSIGISYLSYRYLESPFLHLKKYFRYDTKRAKQFRENEVLCN